MQETELKILNIDKEQVIKKLLELGAVKTFEGKIVEKAFDFPDSRISDAKELLRLRKVGDKIELVYKDGTQEDAQFKIKEETETGLTDFDAMEKILYKVGLQCVKEREKIRTSFEKERLKFEIDQYPQIPAYLEIEGTKEAITQTLALLGFSITQTTNKNSTQVLRSYNADPNFQKF